LESGEQTVVGAGVLMPREGRPIDKKSDGKKVYWGAETYAERKKGQNGEEGNQ